MKVVQIAVIPPFAVHDSPTVHGHAQNWYIPSVAALTDTGRIFVSGNAVKEKATDSHATWYEVTLPPGCD